MYELKLDNGAVQTVSVGGCTVVATVDRKRSKRRGRGSRTRKVVRLYSPSEYEKLTESKKTR